MADYLTFFEQELRGRPDAFTLSSPSQAQQLQALNRLPWVCAAMGPENSQRLLVPFLIDFQQSMKHRDQILAALAVQWRHVVNAMLGRRSPSPGAPSPAGGDSLLLQDENRSSSSRSSYRSSSSTSQRDGQSAAASAGGAASSRNSAAAAAAGRDRRAGGLQPQVASERLAACISSVVKPLEELAAAEEKCVRNEAIASLLYLLELLPSFGSRQRLARDTLLPVVARLATVESGGFFCRCSAAKLLPALYPYAAPAAAAASEGASKAAAAAAGGPGAGTAPGVAGGGARGLAQSAGAAASGTGGKAGEALGADGGGGGAAGDAAAEESTSAASSSVPSPDASSSAAGGGSSRTEGNAAATAGPAGEGSRSASAVDADMEESSAGAAAEIDRAVLRDMFEKLLTHDAVLVKRDAVAEVPSFAKHWLRVRTQQQQELAAAAEAGRPAALEEQAVSLLPLHPQGVEDFFFPILARLSVDSSDFLRCAAVSSLIQLARLYPPGAAGELSGGGSAAAGVAACESSSAALPGSPGAGGGQAVSGAQQQQQGFSDAVPSVAAPSSAPSVSRPAADGAGGAAVGGGGAPLQFEALATLPILSSAGGDSSWRVRAVVAKALPYVVPLFKEQLAALFVPLLQQLLRDSALRDVRQEAIRAVGKLAPSLSPAEVSQHLVPLIPILMQENTAAPAALYPGCQQQQLSAAAAAAAAGGGGGALPSCSTATAFFPGNASATPVSSVAASFLTSTRAAAPGAGLPAAAAGSTGAAGGASHPPTSTTLGINSAAAAAFLASSSCAHPPAFSSGSSSASIPATGSLAAAGASPAAGAGAGTAAGAAGGNGGGTAAAAAGGGAPCGAAAGSVGLAATGGSWIAAEAAGNAGARLSLTAAGAGAPVAGALAISPAMPIVAPPTQNSPLIATSPLLLPVIQAALPVAKAAGPGGLESILSCLANVLLAREELHIRLQIAQEAGEFCRLAAERRGGAAAAGATTGESAQQNDKRAAAAGAPPAAAAPVACPEALKLVDGLTAVLHTSTGGSDWTLRVEIVRQIAAIAEAFGLNFFTDHLQGVFLQAFADYVYDVREATVEVAQSLTDVFGWAWAEEVLLPRLRQIYFGSGASGYGAAALPSAAGGAAPAGNPGSGSSNHHQSGSPPGYGLPQTPVVSYLERITVLHAIPKLAQVVAPAEVETHLLPFLVAALQDAVPNVKLTGAETIRVMLAADLLPRGSTYTKELLPNLRQLVADADIDVRFYAQLALMACKT